MIKINKKKQAALPQKVLHELFDYDSETGKWKWIKKPSNRANVKVGHIAGSVDKKSGYIRIQVNGHTYLSHRLAWLYVYGDYPEGEQPFIDHINGNPSDNRIENLRVSSHGDNQRNLKMNTRNTSGINGVRLRTMKRLSGKIDTYWVAYWCDKSGKEHQKYFSINTCGENEAKQMAIDYRSEQIRLLELNHGIIYSDRHGT